MTQVELSAQLVILINMVTGFPLTGLHTTVECASCHVEVYSKARRATVPVAIQRHACCGYSQVIKARRDK